jgi:hypothetical protein
MNREDLKEKVKAFAKIKDLMNYGGPKPTPTPKPRKTPKPRPGDPRSPDWGDWNEKDRSPDWGEWD